LIFKDGTVNLSTELSSTSNEIELSLNNLHLSPSFKRHFSQKNVANETEQFQTLCHPMNLTGWITKKMKAYGKKNVHHCLIVSNLNAERGMRKESLSMCIQRNVINTPAHEICPPHSDSRVESPDLKIVSCMDSLLTRSPAQSAPERLLLGSDVKRQKMTAQKVCVVF
jgi:hypothetical protein